MEIKNLQIDSTKSLINKIKEEINHKLEFSLKVRNPSNIIFQRQNFKRKMNISSNF